MSKACLTHENEIGMKNKFLVISHFDSAVNLLKLNLSTGRGQLISTDKVDKDQISFGMFEIENHEPHVDLVALLATPDGPLLFLNGNQYRPEIGKTKIGIKDDENLSHFVISHEGLAIFRIFYEKKFGAGLHPYNINREDFDFYYWLYKKISAPELYAVYTRDIMYIGNTGAPV
jgi:hypothetical protein